MKRGHAKNWDAKRFEQTGNRYVLAFSGETVGSIRLGGDVRIYLNDGFATQIDLWMPFTLTQHGQSQVYHPREAQTLAPLLTLIGKELTKAVAAKDRLHLLESEGGMTLEAPSEWGAHEYEAWQIGDKHGFQIVCTIGGSLAIWLPNAEPSRRRDKEGNI